MTFPRVSHLSDQRQMAAAINEALRCVGGHPVPELASAPPTPSEGATYYDLTLHKVRTWDGTLWQNHW